VLSAEPLLDDHHENTNHPRDNRTQDNRSCTIHCLLLVCRQITCSISFYRSGGVFELAAAEAELSELGRVIGNFADSGRNEIAQDWVEPDEDEEDTGQPGSSVGQPEAN
jgi:hypothetical protein